MNWRAFVAGGAAGAVASILVIGPLTSPGRVAIVVAATCVAALVAEAVTEPLLQLLHRRKR